MKLEVYEHYSGLVSFKTVYTCGNIALSWDDLERPLTSPLVLYSIRGAKPYNVYQGKYGTSSWYDVRGWATCCHCNMPYPDPERMQEWGDSGRDYEPTDWECPDCRTAPEAEPYYSINEYMAIHSI